MHAYEVHTYEMHAYEMHAYEMHAYEMHAYEVYPYDIHAHKTHTHEMHACEMHAGKVYACVRGTRLYMQVYEIHAAVGVHLEGTRLGDTSVRCSLPVNVYDIRENFDFRECAKC